VPLRVITTEAIAGSAFYALTRPQPPGAPYLPVFGRCGIPRAYPSSLLRDPLSSPSANSSTLSHPSSLVIPTGSFHGPSD